MDCVEHYIEAIRTAETYDAMYNADSSASTVSGSLVKANDAGLLTKDMQERLGQLIETQANVIRQKMLQFGTTTAGHSWQAK